MRLQPREPRTEYSFHTIRDLVDFTAGEIRASLRTHSDIARAAECTSGTVARLVRGETRYPRAATILQILRALGWTISVRGSNQ